MRIYNDGDNIVKAKITIPWLGVCCVDTLRVDETVETMHQLGHTQVVEISREMIITVDGDGFSVEVSGKDEVDVMQHFREHWGYEVY